MKDIDHLLRQSHPGETPPPALDTRIMARISCKPARARSWTWLWASAAASVAIMAMFALTRNPAVRDTGLKPQAKIDSPAPAVADNSGGFENPLAQESRALRETARKTSLFLLSRFPSDPTAGH